MKSCLHLLFLYQYHLCQRLREPKQWCLFNLYHAIWNAFLSRPVTVWFGYRMKSSLALITHLTDLPLPELLPLPEQLPLPELYKGSVRAPTSLKRAICSWSKLFNILSIDKRSWTFHFHKYRNWSEIDCIHFSSCFLFITSCQGVSEFPPNNLVW